MPPYHTRVSHSLTTCYCSLQCSPRHAVYVSRPSYTYSITIHGHVQALIGLVTLQPTMPRSKLLCCLVLDALFHRANSQPHFLRPPRHSTLQLHWPEVCICSSTFFLQFCMQFAHLNSVSLLSTCAFEIATFSISNSILFLNIITISIILILYISPLVPVSP